MTGGIPGKPNSRSRHSHLPEPDAAHSPVPGDATVTPTVYWLVTSPRLPAGLLSAEAWDAIRSAPSVVAPLDHPQSDALCASGINVIVATDAALAMQSLAAGGLWLAGHHPEDEADKCIDATLVEEFASLTAAGHVSLEIIYGSWDPPGARLLDLVEIIDRLRHECPWQASQGHESLAPYLLEETYEVLDAINDHNRDSLREELGDLLLQPMLHAHIASEHTQEPFSIDDVASDLIDKLVRRHPHVFGDADPADLFELWDEAKNEEKPERADNPAAGISEQLPALAMASKVMDRFAMAGKPIDVPILPDPAAKVMFDEIGTGVMLLSVVRIALANGIDPELALRNTMRYIVAAGGQVRHPRPDNGDESDSA